jgi:hypothetical protein
MTCQICAIGNSLSNFIAEPVTGSDSPSWRSAERAHLRAHFRQNSSSGHHPSPPGQPNTIQWNRRKDSYEKAPGTRWVWTLDPDTQSNEPGCAHVRAPSSRQRRCRHQTQTHLAAASSFDHVFTVRLVALQTLVPTSFVPTRCPLQLHIRWAFPYPSHVSLHC